MQIQELITYVILGFTGLYCTVRIVKTITGKKPASSCAEGGCSGCNVKNNCGSSN